MKIDLRPRHACVSNTKSKPPGADFGYKKSVRPVIIT